MTNKEIKSKLIELAAEIIWCTNMPSTFIEDHETFPKSTPKKVIRKILRDATAIENQCKEWGCKIRDLSDAIEVNNDK